MTNKTKAGRRRSNPLLRNQARVGRPRIGFDGQLVRTTAYADQSAIGAVDAKVGIDWFGVEGGSGEAINRSAQDVIKHYQEYRYRSASMEWNPRVGPANSESGARVYMAYIDNPELINAFKALAAGAGNPTLALGRVKAVANVRAFNAWERFTFRVPLTYRRKWFNVNTSVGSSTNNEETDRSFQGLVIVAYQAVADTVTGGSLGQFRMMSETDIRGFTGTSLT